MKSICRKGGLVEERRKFGRVRFDQLIELRFGRYFSAGQLLDVSSRGAKFSVSTGLVPNVGARLSMQLLDGTELECRICWAGIQNIGVSFNDLILDLDRFRYQEDFEQSVLTQIARFQKKLRRTVY